MNKLQTKQWAETLAPVRTLDTKKHSAPAAPKKLAGAREAEARKVRAENS